MRVIEVQDLQVQRAGRLLCSVPQLQVPAGGRLALTGANGSGKTTLLRVLAGLEASWAGHCAVGVPVEQRTFVHEEPWMFRGSVLHNVTYGLRARGQRGSGVREAALHWLDQLGMANKAQRASRDLSAGETRRVALARALVLQPQLLLLDEPLSDLDAAGIDRVTETLSSLPEVTIVLSSPMSIPEALATHHYTVERASASSH